MLNIIILYIINRWYSLLYTYIYTDKEKLTHLKRNLYYKINNTFFIFKIYNIKNIGNMGCINEKNERKKKLKYLEQFIGKKPLFPK